MERWLCALSALFALFGVAVAAELGIMPVTVQLDRLRDRATVQVVNMGTEAVTLQADAVAWQRQNGQDVDSPTDELILNPPLFTVAAGQTQVLRVGLRREAAGDRETTYRLVMRELPPPPGQRLLLDAQVRVLVSLRLPVYVAPRQVQRDARWTVHQAADGGVHAEVSNQGNVHMKVGALRLRDAGSLTLAEQRPGAVLFPGESQRFRLQAPPPGGALTLEVLGDQGVHHVAVSAPGR